MVTGLLCKYMLLVVSYCISFLYIFMQINQKTILVMFCHRFYDAERFFYAYTVYAAACSEVEIDVLTGEHSILRSDIVYDCGERYACYIMSTASEL